MEILKVVLLGLGTVFIGLTIIILLIELLHAVLKNTGKKQTDTVPQKVENRQEREEIPHGELVACIAAAIAEELGKDVSAIRIHSIKKV